ncbi:glycosyltransferase [Bradyrhizobium sp. WYCCWR 13023]|uniref:Glycosyltransferase n=1 Tax=Bradyrhizobium zhengyangense TaxID=2911009 RepID=A0A9X1RF50_9BRAD|nr:MULTISPECIES: glycosyltransferase [Bradyrhizobium]MCG2631534.1 glycosyltransferase [Bradyrhizobium zhengyangense]MCG2671394.1 glycosyltransferase [Bradyrhizobium zhengyangense]MDA9522835.1 glycosyl transferase [Bradyrhizobium sp. CCBAU 11434]
MSSGLKVLHVAETVRGGIATYLNELHPHQSASFGRGNVSYVVPSDHRDDLVSIEDDAITTFPRDGRNAMGLFAMLSATMRAVRQLRPDIIHLHSSFAGLVVRPMLWLTYRHSRIVYCPHGWAFGRETGRVSRAITQFTELALSKLTHRIVCISRSEQLDATRVGIATKRLVLVHNGISKQRPALNQESASASEKIWRSDKIKVLFIGRLDRQKGCDLLIKAARELGETLDVRIIGASVVSKFNMSDLPANVSLLGWMDRNQIEAQLDEADLVAIPSRWEAFGLVAIEAMRAAKPIIAFRIGALPEIVEDDVTGVLCDEVTPEKLIDGFQRASRLDLAAVGRAGYERFVRLYDIEQTHRTLGQVYADVLHMGENEAGQPANLQSDFSNNLRP